MTQQNDQQMTLAKIVEQKKAQGIRIVIENDFEDVPVKKPKKNFFGKIVYRVVGSVRWNWYSIIEDGTEWIKVGAVFNDGTPLENKWFEYGKKQMPNVTYDEVVQSIYRDVQQLHNEQEAAKRKAREAEEWAERQRTEAEIKAAKSRVYLRLAAEVQQPKK